MKQVNIYGIPNCDITKKALKWLKEKNVDFVFHDYKTVPPTKPLLNDWCKKVGWETLFNKKSTTWRSLDAGEQSRATNQEAAIRIMMQHNSIIKRPVIESGNKLLVGFNEENYSKQLK